MEKISEAVCSVTARALLKTAEVRDCAFAEIGKSLFVVYNDEIMSNKIIDKKLYELSAKQVDIDFDANSILAFSFPKLREKSRNTSRAGTWLFTGNPFPCFALEYQPSIPWGTTAKAWPTGRRSETITDSTDKCYAGLLGYMAAQCVASAIESNSCGSEKS